MPYYISVLYDCEASGEIQPAGQQRHGSSSCSVLGSVGVQGDQLAGMWSAALPLGLEGKMAALQAALEFIGTPPPPVASARTGGPPRYASRVASSTTA